MKTPIDHLGILRDVIDHLKKAEIVILRKYLANFSNRNQDSSLNTATLFNVLTSYPHLSHEGIRKKLLKSYSPQMINKIAIRLENKILESLILAPNTNRKNTYTEHEIALFEANKGLLQLKILWERGVHRKEILSWLTSLINKAKKFELYTELTEALYYKQQGIGLLKNKREYDAISNEIIFYERCRTAKNNARDRYHQITLYDNSLKALPDYNRFLKEVILELMEDYNYTRSAHVGYYFYYASYELYRLENNYAEAGNTCNELIALIKTSPAIYTKTRLGIIYTDLANTSVRLHDFDKAIKYVEIAHNYFPKNSMRYFSASEPLFYTHILQNNIEDATKVIEQLVENKKLLLSEFQEFKRLYLYACLLTIKGQNKKSLALLNKAKRPDKENEIWNLGVRVLTIINQIDLGLFDYADASIRSLYKYYNRTLKKHLNVPERCVIIIKLLSSLSTSTFDFNKLYRLKKKQLNKLRSDHPDCKWDILGPELIPFHEWVSAKYNKMSYSNKALEVYGTDKTTNRSKAETLERAKR